MGRRPEVPPRRGLSPRDPGEGGRARVGYTLPVDIEQADHAKPCNAVIPGTYSRAWVTPGLFGHSREAATNGGEGVLYTRGTFAGRGYQSYQKLPAEGNHTPTSCRTRAAELTGVGSCPAQNAREAVPLSDPTGRGAHTGVGR